jgi:hypothetical protein
MEKIPTAEEFLKDLQHGYEETGEYKMYFAIDIPDKLREFAKLHVEAALKEASEKGEAVVRTNGEWTSSKVTAGVNKESILKSYSLENIK